MSGSSLSESRGDRSCQLQIEVAEFDAPVSRQRVARLLARMMFDRLRAESPSDPGPPDHRGVDPGPDAVSR